MNEKKEADCIAEIKQSAFKTDLCANEDRRYAISEVFLGADGCVSLDGRQILYVPHVLPTGGQPIGLIPPRVLRGVASMLGPPARGSIMVELRNDEVVFCRGADRLVWKLDTQTSFPEYEEILRNEPGRIVRLNVSRAAKLFRALENLGVEEVDMNVPDDQRGRLNFESPETGIKAAMMPGAYPE